MLINTTPHTSASTFRNRAISKILTLILTTFFSAHHVYAETLIPRLARSAVQVINESENFT